SQFHSTAQLYLSLLIMAAGTHSPGGPNGIIRSQSFAGFSTLQERRSRCNSFMGNSAVQKKPTSKPKKPHLSGHKASSGSREPKPERVEEVYGALKQGLDEYLEVHQTGLDKLTSLMKDMKRNSRLVRQDQIKTIERYMRRLEFHMSKVDELYEAFCIQRRLREGASKMKQAFSASPSTKATRESMSEVNRRYKEYTENMSTLEGELENMLGEFHIKMKGKTEASGTIFMRYGRQRWKLKGKIEVNSRQSWDGEEMVFMPLITDLINIKVTELKGLATHILVGSVICETKDLFTAMPQVVAVDVNDLGTIKLNLEVTWFPFDVEDLTLSSGNVSKATALQRRVSVYSQGTPETPTFQDQSFFSTLPDDVFESGGCGNAECKRLSFTFSDTSVSSPSLAPGQSNPEITVTPPETCPQPQIPNVEVTVRIHADVVEEAEEGEEEEESRGSSGSVRTMKLCCIVTYSIKLYSIVSSELLKPVELDTEEPGSLTRQLVRRLTSSDILPEAGVLSWAGEGSRAFLESSLEETLQSLLLRLESLGQRCRELQDLEQEVMRLEDLLKCRLPGHRSRSSSLSLMVESALESFDFLNTSDFDDDDTGDDHALQHSVFFDMEAESIGPGGQHPEARGHLSEALMEDTGVGNSVPGSPLPLTTGNENLDVAIVIHLQYCDHLIQLLSSGGSPWQRRAQLQKLSAQTQLLEELGEISTERLGSITSAADGEYCLSTVTVYISHSCLSTVTVYISHSCLSTVTVYISHSCLSTVTVYISHGCLSLASPVIRLVVSEMVDRSDLASSPTCHPPSALSQDVVTVFQFQSYVSEHSVEDMEEHLLQVAREAVFAEGLSGGDSERCLKELEEVSHTVLCPRQQTLRALASLLSHQDPQLSEAAAAYITSASSHTPFRSKVSVGVARTSYYSGFLSPSQAVESLWAVVSMCDSADEELRHVAMETLLTFGEEGRLAYEQLDTMPREMVRLGTRRGNAVTTAF
uniref:Rho family-interacting cell polarization regulator 2 n=1 Tax=Salmo trutta TaxID=8032 RepID=A0A674E7B3_SALTR